MRAGGPIVRNRAAPGLSRTAAAPSYSPESEGCSHGRTPHPAPTRGGPLRVRGDSPPRPEVVPAGLVGVPRGHGGVLGRALAAQDPLPLVARPRDEPRART